MRSLTRAQRRAIRDAVRYWQSITRTCATGLTPFARPAYSFANVIRDRVQDSPGGDPATPTR